MPSVKDEIAKNLQYYRKKSNLTQKELAALLGVKNTSISNWEVGRNEIDIDTLVQVCKILNISISEIYGIYGMQNADETKIKLDNQEQKLLNSFRTLNNDGKEKAVNYVSDLAEMPKYTEFSEAKDA